MVKFNVSVLNRLKITFFFLIIKHIHEHNVSFNKTLTKLVTILTKCFFPYLNPTSYLKTITNKIPAATDDLVAPRNETMLQTLLSNYKLENTINFNYFELLFKCVLTKAYHIYEEKCFDGKKSKVQFTGMAATSAAVSNCQCLKLINLKNHDVSKTL